MHFAGVTSTSGVYSWNYLHVTRIYYSVYLTKFSGNLNNPLLYLRRKGDNDYGRV